MKYNNAKSYDKSDKAGINEIPENIVVGRNAVTELLKSGRSVDKVVIAKGAGEGSVVMIEAMARGAGIPVVRADRAKFDAISCGANHQGVMAYAAEKEYCSVDDILKIASDKGEAPFIVICDDIEDPHNLGAIIRSAECTGVHGVIIPKRRSAGMTPVVVKSSAGASEYMPVAKVTNIAATIDELKKKGIWIYGAEAGGDDIYKTDLSGPAAFVLGSEGAGISRLIKEKCDFIVSIPMYGKVNSFNVSCAASIILCEAAHKRNN